MENKAETKEIPCPALMLLGMNTPEAALFLVDRSPFVMGKDLACDGVIPGVDEISRRHAMITLREEGYTLTDLDSMNGTTLNDERLQPGKEYPVAAGDVIGLAMVRLNVSKLKL